jgi:hypothetical protein
MGTMKKSLLSVGCTVWLLCGGAALAHLTDDDFATPTPRASRSVNGFSATLLLSDAPDEVLQTWTAPTTIDAAVKTTDTIKRGTPIVAFVFFSGCLPDENGMCNASADFTILRPDGSVYESFNDRDLWRDKPAPPDGTLGLSAEYVGVVIEPDDPLGTYQVRVDVHDLNADTVLPLRDAFTAVPGR